jgi:cobalamin synthase
VTLPLAAENLPSSLYTPLIVLLVVYVALTLIAGRARSNDDTARTDRFETIAFGVLLVTAAYTVILVISAIFSYPSRSTDMVTILLVVGAFFALLVFVFFLISEWLPRRFRGERTER